jgi:3-dehydroquinate synthase
VPESFLVRPSAAEAGWRTRVVVSRGALLQAADAIVVEFPGSRVVVVSDARVARIVTPRFLARLGARGVRALRVTFPAGESHKTRETKAAIEDRLAGAGIGRDAVVAAVGGGVTGDLAGFVAATWHRGLPVVQVPTTLLAMVDASLGGKTAVDTPAGKNLVGAFHHPASLWADADVLDSLPPRAYRSGLAEAVKIAAALDASLFRALERDAAALVARNPDAVEAVVARCLRLKGRVVASDPRESGPRAALNFGHTVGHGIEAASGWRLAHGEAVAIGIVAEARMAERLVGFPAADTERVTALLERFGLPVRAPASLDLEAFVRFAKRDKKGRAGEVRCALPLALGSMPAGRDPTVAVAIRRDILPALRPN